MKHWRITTVVILSVLLLSVAAPAYAAPATTTLPPLPEWPIIGPILRWLGVVEETPEEIVEMPEEPDLPEYQIETWDDITALQDLASGERVRVLATDSALTAIAQKPLTNTSMECRTSGRPSQKQATGYVELIRRCWRSRFRPPVTLKNTLKIEATLTFQAGACRRQRTVERVSINKCIHRTARP